jgi:hypothetical protein
MKTIHKIKHPTVTTYFIAHGETVSYGEVSPEQTMATGLPNLWQTTDKTEWIEKLKNDFNITPETE